ncbi:twin-arginine translocation pathway signal protein [Rhodospirillum rubrum]|nr:twin-arginine translocation pathway signal protein [Rhodospirillum rubrum]MBK1677811.1 twin-arginine translocation pathway signal protein [Rhodospirillum rubrum]
MPMKGLACPSVTRRSFIGLCTGAVAALHAPAAFASRRSTIERSLSLENLHTGERVKRVYWANGRYVPDSLREIDHVLRDFRTGDVQPIDRGLLDLLYELHATLETRAPFQVISGYRSPRTNALLRETGGGGVAKQSLHMRGMAIDIALKDRTISQLRRGALGLRRGGVGYYPESGFVHVDVGKVRSW